MKILLTAFEPFGDESINASCETLKCLPSEIQICNTNNQQSELSETQTCKDNNQQSKLSETQSCKDNKQQSKSCETIQIKKLLVPTVFHKSIDVLEAAIELEQPEAVLCLGQAAGRCDITPERVAINIDDARIKDNEGNQPVDIPIFKDGAPAYFSTLPVKAMVQNMKDAGIPASLSNTAGTFVCNHLMYGLLYTLDKHYPHIRGGFIHIPLLPEQAIARSTATSSMSKEMIARGIEAAIKSIFQNSGISRQP